MAGYKSLLRALKAMRAGVYAELALEETERNEKLFDFACSLVAYEGTNPTHGRLCRVTQELAASGMYPEKTK